MSRRTAAIFLGCVVVALVYILGLSMATSHIEKGTGDTATIQSLRSDLQKAHSGKAACAESARWYKEALNEYLFQVKAHEDYGTQYTLDTFYKDLERARTSCDIGSVVVGSES